MTKQLRLGDVQRNKDDLDKATKLLAIQLMSGSSNVADHSVDLAVFLLLKVSNVS
jgi:hypothetical protein